MSKPAGILGGTFDPPHWGHLTAAREIRKALGLEEVFFMPNRIPPHKPPATASDADRLAMLRLICREYPEFRCLDTELRRQDSSYLADTLLLLRQEPLFKSRGIIFIIGADSLQTLHTWSRPGVILENCSLAVACRPGYSLSTVSDLVRAHLTSQEDFDPARSGQILLLDTSPMDISSTFLRAHPETISPMTVPEPVAAYIRKHHLYHHD